MYIQRTVESSIQRVGESFPCIVIYGPRQVGKSTTVDHIFGSKFHQVTLDDLDDLTLAKSNPRLFLESNGWPLIIDEIQKAPQLLDEIKKIIDEQRIAWLKSDSPRQLMYVLTGSNRFELQEGISDSLSGRCGVIEMASFSNAELLGIEESLFNPDILTLKSLMEAGLYKHKTKADIFEEIFRGGMPDICVGVSERDVYFKSYVNTYIEKDIHKLIDASSDTQFRNFISLLALRTAQELHYDEIASAAGIDTRTCKRWISLLETSGIVYLMQPYMANISNRIIKAPKLYFMDTGLCAFLCKWPNAEMLSDCAMSGAFFETYVVSELVKNAYSHYRDPKDYLFYYRDIDQKEIDLLYIEGQKIYPIEIKVGDMPAKATKNFSVLSKYQMKVEKGIVVCNCDKIRAINDHAFYVPVSLLP